MKQTDFHKRIKKENIHYYIVKSLAFLRMKLSYGEKRVNNENMYSIFGYDHDFDEGDNSLPGELYYKPTDIIMYDLIRKEDLTKTKTGLINLIKRYNSHKFIYGGRFAEDIDVMIKGLDQSLHSGNSWYRTSIFDFANDKEIDSYIHHFELLFHNFSASFVAVEMHITLSDAYVDELSQFNKRQYKKQGMCVHKNWSRNKRKNGARIAYSVSSGVLSEYAKSQIVYEQLQIVKSKYLKIIGKYIPIMIYSLNRNIKSINVYETNITPSLDLKQSIHIGLGLDEMKGFFFSPYARLYTNTVTADRQNNYESDMIFVYNPELIKDYKHYVSAHNKMMEELTRDYMEKLYRIVVLNNLGQTYLNKIIAYRNRVNKCKTDKKSNKRLLQIQYEINKDFYDFMKIDEELPVNKEFEEAEIEISNNKFAVKSIDFLYHTCEQFYTHPKYIWEKVKDSFSEVEGDLVRKLAISESLSKYIGERKSMILISIQVILALISIVLLVFNDLAGRIAKFLEATWNYIITHI